MPIQGKPFLSSSNREKGEKKLMPDVWRRLCKFRMFLFYRVTCIIYLHFVFGNAYLTAICWNLCLLNSFYSVSGCALSHYDNGI